MAASSPASNPVSLRSRGPPWTPTSLPPIATLTTARLLAEAIIGLAYAVISDYWSQGFATEMAQASLGVGFGRLGFSEIGSWTLPANPASQRVMEKPGFRYERDFEFAGLLHRSYRLVKAEWKGYDGGDLEEEP
jgi:hypothetical protein